MSLRLNGIVLIKSLRRVQEESSLLKPITHGGDIAKLMLLSLQNKYLRLIFHIKGREDRSISGMGKKLEIKIANT